MTGQQLVHRGLVAGRQAQAYRYRHPGSAVAQVGGIGTGDGQTDEKIIAAEMKIR